MKLISKFALLITIAAILLLLVSGNLFSSALLVILGQILAVGLAVWARRSFQDGQFSIQAEPEKGSLLLTGPYQWIRHPMYAAALLLVWAGVLGHLWWGTAVIGFITTAVIAVRIMTEEKLLRANYPNYAEYAHKTKRIIPFVI